MLHLGNYSRIGNHTLALVENGLPATDIQKARNNIAKAADRWLENIEEQGYRLPIKQAEMREAVIHGVQTPSF